MDVRDHSVLLMGADSGAASGLAARSPGLTFVGRRRGPLDEVAAGVRERGGQAHVVALNREDPAAVDRTSLARKGALGEAVAGHPSLCPPSPRRPSLPETPQ